MTRIKQFIQAHIVAIVMYIILFWISFCIGAYAFKVSIVDLI